MPRRTRATRQTRRAVGRAVDVDPIAHEAWVARVDRRLDRRAPVEDQAVDLDPATSTPRRRDVRRDRFRA